MIDYSHEILKEIKKSHGKINNTAMKRRTTLQYSVYRWPGAYNEVKELVG